MNGSISDAMTTFAAESLARVEQRERQRVGAAHGRKSSGRFRDRLAADDCQSDASARGHARCSRKPPRNAGCRRAAARESSDSVAMLPEREFTSKRWVKRWRSARAEGVWHVVFGDLFLEDIRAYREKQLAGCGMTRFFRFGEEIREILRKRCLLADFWHISRVLIRAKLDRSFAGRHSMRIWWRRFRRVGSVRRKWRVSHLSRMRDPCFGEAIPVAVRRRIVERDGFVFADLLPNKAEA